MSIKMEKCRYFFDSQELEKPHFPLIQLVHLLEMMSMAGVKVLFLILKVVAMQKPLIFLKKTSLLYGRLLSMAASLKMST